ncbi:MAG: class I SAM-dependent methyltransferase [Burkholderiales bacterium]|nr:class I SAM-dependent methyltransferase [Burkholderiales bacterium]
MTDEPTRDVRQLYEAFPYPSPAAGDALIFDVANMAALLFPPGFLDGKSVLDAGCGSGHRLVAFARRFPACRFLGIDMTSASLDTARQLAGRHGAENLRLRQHDLLELDLPERFDVIVSTGVINCLADPGRGLGNLCRHLKADGHIVLWHYHACGEWPRLLERELLLTFWDRHGMSLHEGVEIMRALGLSLGRDRYSSVYAARDTRVMDEASMNVDAYLHPIVHAYRFDEAFDMLWRAGMDWAAVHGVNLGRTSKLLDPAGAAEAGARMFCLRADELFSSPAILQRYARLSPRDKLRAIELAARPNGFSMIAGRTDTRPLFDARLRGGALRGGAGGPGS